MRALGALPSATLIGTLLLAACSSGAVPSATVAAGTTATAPSKAASAAATPGKDVNRVVKDGDKVRVNYRGTLDDGTEFDSSKGRSPLAFQVGSGQVIRGFDDAVRGLKVGESRTVRMEAKDAYGEANPDLVRDVPAAQAPAGLKAGDKVRLGNGQPAVVREVTPEYVKIDANHELAGKALTFEVELVAID